MHSFRLLGIRLGSLFAICASSALLLHYLDPAETAFCGTASGCEAVRKAAPSLFGMQHGIPLFGMGAYLIVLWLSFAPEQRRVLGWLSILGGVLGAGLLSYQAIVIGSLCWLCVLVDAIAIGVGSAGFALMRTHAQQTEPLRGWCWLALLAISIYSPNAWTQLRPPRGLPPSIQALQEPNKVNVIEFVDFQCPHCRRLHPALKAELSRLSGSVSVQRYHVPLAFHPDAEPAARAAICATEQGKEHEMADLLFSEPLQDQAHMNHAKRLQLDMARFEACLGSDATKETLAKHYTLFKSTGSSSLPLTFIDGTMIEGAPSTVHLVRTFDRALSPKPFRLAAWQFIAILCGLLLGLIGVGRRPKPKQ